MATINLGTNKFINCGTALLLRGEEVFHLREGENTDQLLVDFDLYNQKDERLLRVKKNQVVHAAPGYAVRVEAKKVTVTDEQGVVVATAEQTDLDTVSVTGTFWRHGVCCVITSSELKCGGLTTRNGTSTNCGAGISIG